MKVIFVTLCFIICFSKPVILFTSNNLSLRSSRGIHYLSRNLTYFNKDAEKFLTSQPKDEIFNNLVRSENIKKVADVDFYNVWKPTGNEPQFCHRPSLESGLIERCIEKKYPAVKTTCFCTGCSQLMNKPTISLKCGEDNQWYPHNDGFQIDACGQKAAEHPGLRCNVCPSLRHNNDIKCPSDEPGKEGDRRSCICLHNDSYMVITCGSEKKWILDQECIDSTLVQETTVLTTNLPILNQTESTTLNYEEIKTESPITTSTQENTFQENTSEVEWTTMEKIIQESTISIEKEPEIIDLTTIQVNEINTSTPVPDINEHNSNAYQQDNVYLISYISIGVTILLIFILIASIIFCIKFCRRKTEIYNIQDKRKVITVENPGYIMDP